MKLTFASLGDFSVECSFNLNGETAPVEWKITAPGLPKRGGPSYNEYYYDNLNSNNIYFDWYAVDIEKNLGSPARVVCMSKGHGFGFNQVEAQIPRGAQDLV